MLSIVIILKIPYTEIDWKAYMEEVEFVFDQGEMDYRKIRGGTGPLVYPAGFVYLFGAMRWMTGEEVKIGQWIFCGFYVINAAIVLTLYTMAVRSIRKYSLNNGITSLKKTDAKANQAHFDQIELAVAQKVW
eukprot:CAMPEP_0194357592 /NCGR_PEP_ID=MMETSP0174-20130528/5053_1 /TAXON_ID=216777 /ORGANISM="Proboscia alata, Strain PI-D3" /LENGTH=131 /DNA_ID=CAMNT_0039127679 /DNA_START=120 /DNA_END=512 /DNA_ORIENTATION=-